MSDKPDFNGVNVKVVGLGGAGARVVDSLAALGFPAARFLAVDSDIEKLQHCQLAEKLQLGESIRRGWGCSGDATAERWFEEEHHLPCRRSIVLIRVV